MTSPFWSSISGKVVLSYKPILPARFIICSHSSALKKLGISSGNSIKVFEVADFKKKLSHIEETKQKLE